MIKELIIRDFFSFKGEHTIELNTGVNILVGVNGSGKTTLAKVALQKSKKVLE